LQNKIQNAKKRIYLSTLYIGKTEYELLETLSESLRRNPDLKVSILTDALRGTREAPKQSCASLLARLVAEHGPDRVEIRMFHTPNLVGLRKKYVPRRINEGWGLQHMKLYGVDDEIILSGYECPQPLPFWLMPVAYMLSAPTFLTTTSQTGWTGTMLSARKNSRITTLAFTMLCAVSVSRFCRLPKIQQAISSIGQPRMAGHLRWKIPRNSSRIPHPCSDG
jgi:hypothetical protein